MSSSLQTHQLDLGYHRTLVVEGLDLTIPTGSFTALVGANGSGKSTILNACARLLKPKQGAVQLADVDLHGVPTKMVARWLAILPQQPTAPAGLTVEELVAHGRYPHRRAFGGRSRGDRDAVAWALETAQLTDFAQRTLGELSGGERQRVWIAMALAQQTPVLLLDEPTAALDVAHQLEVMTLLQRLNQEEGKTIVAVLHDLNLAARFATRMVMIKDGAIVAEGTPVEVITAENLRVVFGIEAEILRSARHGAPVCVPHLG